MVNYILRRFALLVPTLIGMSFILFSVVRAAPGLTSSQAFGTANTGNEGAMQSNELHEQMRQAALRRLHMIDENGKPIPLPLQFTGWLWDSVRGKFGESIQYKGVPVLDLIEERLPTTLALNVISTLLIYLIAIPGGMLSATQRAGTFDRLWGLGSLALYSLPQIWIGGLLIGYLANPQNLGWFPPAGLHSLDTDHFTFFLYSRDYLWHLVLPLALYTYGGFAVMSKQMRASILDNLDMDYSRTARAKGVPALTVLTRHVFRNSLIPLIVMSAGLLPGLLGGSIVVEEIFSIKGMGQLAIEATRARDLPVIQATAFIGSVLSLISLLLADLAMAIADPRVSYD
jgi:ABC-type dipeptide/oligopeptide/nickel transport system permease component